MAFFQNSVLKKYLQSLDKQQIFLAYSKFKEHFHNREIQQNIRSSKEEQYQEGFLRDLFVGVLGYTLNPIAGFNLTTEYKNVKDSKKADGAIILPSTMGQAQLVRAVIELKGTDTTDLDKIEPQAFGYKNNQPECTYIIISNFEKLRFYIDNAIDHIEFNLFTLNEKEFELLWLCLAYENIAADLPKKIKNASLSEEDTITKNLYKDYSLFKRELHHNLVALNPEIDELLLFKKSQKLLDRFLFLLFAEDRQLLPPNSVREILNQWNKLKEMDVYFPLYSRFKMYFGYLNTGFKGKQYDVFAYNGGLFKTDEILDAVEIDDDLLYRHTMKLSEYDFVSEVDVNILGHIFENSLNELDEIKSQLSGEVVDKTKTKRKKDGVFYTPKFITKYIVDNTVGKLCAEKQAELGIKDEDYSADKKQNKNTKKLLLDKLKAYREWLLQITICDPACGSGAFLVQALDFLISEHQYIDELQAKLFGDTLVLSDVENSILENNLFGVDINEESVEIAKLSLWLRTAQPNRKLNDLNNNIKCGNSLIEDPKVAGDKAFNWEKEFPRVFGTKVEKDEAVIPEIPETPDYLKLIKEKSIEVQLKAEQGIALSKEALEIAKELAEYAQKLEAVSAPKVKYNKLKGGFDVVIGNPPYVRAELFSQQSKYYESKYKTYQPAADLFTYFYELGFSILKQNGLFGFISNTFDKTKAAIILRDWLKYNTYISKYIDFTDVQIFDGATTYPIIFIAKNKNQINSQFEYIKIVKGKEQSIEFYNPCIIEQGSLEKENWSFKNNSAIDILKKIQQHPSLPKKYGKCYYGVKTALNEAFLIPKELYGLSEFIKPIYEGRELSKWINTDNKQSLILFKSKSTKEKFGDLNESDALKKIRDIQPEIIKHLLQFEEKAKIRYDKGDYWWELRNCAYYHLFEQPKIIFPNLQNRNKFSIDNKGIYINAPAVMLSLAHLENPIAEGKFLLGVLNSKLIWYFLKSICVVRSGGYIEVKPQYFEQIPIPLLSFENQKSIIEKTDNMLSKNKEFQQLSHKFQRMLQRKFDLEELPVKLQNWYTLSFKEFIAELGKKKIKFSLAQEAEWEDYFSAEQAKAIEIKKQIDDTDHEIDRMVYALYELTEEEIKIVEGK